MLFVDHTGAYILNVLGYHKSDSYRDLYTTRYYGYTIDRYPMSISRDDLPTVEKLLDEAKSVFFSER
jgi:hypothetical protein